MTNVCARTPAGMLAPGAELRIPGTGAQTRMVSVARIRLDSRKSTRPFKGIICDDISEFESHMASHAVGLRGSSFGRRCRVRQRGSDASPVPAHMQPEAVRCCHEDAGEAPVRMGIRRCTQPLGNVWNARPNASARPSTQTTRWLPMVQRAANTPSAPSSACPHPARLWRRPTGRPLDFQRAVTIPRIQSSPRSSKTDGKCHPRPHHRPAA
jgi:hypothetical protein